MRSDESRWLALLAVGVFGLLAWMLLRTHQEEKSRQSRYSTFRSDPEGSRAFFLLAQKLGFQSIRLKQNLRILPKGRLLFLLEPSFLSKQEVKAVEAWIRRGNTLVLASRRQTALHRALGFSIQPLKGEVSKKADADDVSRKADADDVSRKIDAGDVSRKIDAGDVSRKADQALKRASPDGGTMDLGGGQEGKSAGRDGGLNPSGSKEDGILAQFERKREAGELLGLWFPEDAFLSRWPKKSRIFASKGGHCRLVRSRVGLGTVFVSSSPELFSNLGLGKKGNVWFASHLLRLYGRRQPVLFDEYHHGYRFERTLLMYIFYRGWGGALLQLIVAFALFLWWNALPGGGREKPEETPWRGEHVDALAQLYRKARATPHSAQLLAWELRQLLSQALGNRRWREPDELLSLLEQKEIPYPEKWPELLLAIEGAAERDEAPLEQELIEYAAVIDWLRDTLQQKGAR